MNYPVPEFLHQYDYYGHGNIRRQAVKRKKDAFTEKIAGMDTFERHILIESMVNSHPSEVKHFLTTTDRQA
jgi:hypothetical protein